MRLLTAIPLLFWVGSAAVAHFVHACVAAPVVATGVANGDPAFEAAPAQADTVADLGTTFCFDAEYDGQRAAVPPRPEGQAPLSAGSLTVREQVFASARLFANPPPFAA